MCILPTSGKHTLILTNSLEISLPLSPSPPFAHALSSVQTCLSAWMSPCCIYSGQDSCLPCIMCPLRAASGRWKPTRALGIQQGSHSYGKVCKHMVLNRDVQRFSLNVPPTCRIWLKCNEVLVRDGRWLRWPDSHYCLVIGCQAVDAMLRYTSPPYQRNIMNYDCRWLNIWQTFSMSKHAIEHHKHWICIIIFFSCFIYKYIVRYSGFGTWLLCFMIPAEINKMQHETVQYSLFRSKEIGLWMGPCNRHHPLTATGRKAISSVK